MSELLIAAILYTCINTSDTKIQKEECISHFGNCVADYKKDDEAFNLCSKKWNKVKDEIK